MGATGLSPLDSGRPRAPRQRKRLKAVGRLIDVPTEAQPQPWQARPKSANVERTLIDCHERPRIVGSAEVWIRAWARAFGEGRVDVERLLDYARATGSTAARRTAVLLSFLGHGPEAREGLPSRVRRADRIVPFLANGPRGGGEHEVEPYWRVAFNLPRSTIEGWLAYER